VHGKFQGAFEIRAETGELQLSAIRFRLSMRFDRCAKARAIHKIDVPQINYDFRRA